MCAISQSDSSSLDRGIAPPASGAHVDRTIRRQAFLIFCVLMFCYSYVHQRPGWNQNSRLDLLHAIFVHKTLKIDAYHENTSDKSIHNGHYYSDKAPGIVVLALPACALSAGILKAFEIDIDSPKGWLISDWITTALSVGLITAIGGAAMFLFLCKFVPPHYAFLTTLAVFLGSGPFPYATMLFSHAAVIGLLCIALWAIADQKFLIRHIRTTRLNDSRSPHWKLRHTIAGFCCGFAIASEFPAAIAAAGVLALATLATFKRGLLLALAAIPPLILIPAYNWACFGGPLSFGYHHLALTEFQEMNKGLFGITFPPKPSAAYLILLSPERGLFFWTPFFLLAFLGIKPLWQSSQTIFWASSVVVVCQVIAISGYYMPSGGAALGPRHLAPLAPFLTLFAALAFCRHSYLGSYLGLYSLLLTGAATIVEAMPPEDAVNPVLDFYPSRILNGKLANTVAFSLGLPLVWTTSVIVAGLLGPYLIACFKYNTWAVAKRRSCYANWVAPGL